MMRARASANATREVSIVIQRRPHCSATVAVVPEPQVGSSTKSPGSVAIRRHLASRLFGYGDGTYRRRKVGSRAHPIPDLVEVVLQVGFELLDRLTIRARCTTFGFDRFIGFVHSLLIDVGRLACRTHRRPPVFQLFRSYDRLTRPLRSSPITSLHRYLRIGPPQCSASVLSPRGFRRLGFSLAIRATGSCSSAQEPASESRPLYAGRRLPSHQAPNRLVPEGIHAPGFDDACFFTTRLRRVHFRSSLGCST